MRQFLIAAMSAVLAHAKGTMLAVLLLGCLAGKSQGASIVRVTYIQNDQKVGAGIYTGSDGGAGSEPIGYWALSAGPPEIVPDDVTIVPDKENGRVATLRGKIHISLTIRNSINMGIVELDSLIQAMSEAQSGERNGLADEIAELVPMSGHPTGFFMARLIRTNLGDARLLDEIGNPFAFCRTYHEAAQRSKPEAPMFSELGLAYLAGLEERCTGSPDLPR